MRRLLVIGIGAGDPGQLTIEAIDAIAAADVFLVLDKGEDKDQLVAARRSICDRFATRPGWRLVTIPDPERDRNPSDYGTTVADWHQARADRIGAALHDELADDGVAAILVWGDPSLYDSTLRIVDDLHRRGTIAFEHRVVPGVTAISALAARHRIPVHGIGQSFVVTTGRRLRDEGWPARIPNVVVMLDADPVATLRFVPPDTEVFWSAYLGLPQELNRSGGAADLADALGPIRAEARAEHGWIMDIFLLRARGI